MAGCGSGGDSVKGGELAKAVRSVASASARVIEETGAFRSGVGSRQALVAALDARARAREVLDALSARASADQKSKLEQLGQADKDFTNALNGIDKVIAMIEQLSQANPESGRSMEQVEREADGALRPLMEYWDLYRLRCASVARSLE
jgi:hypothetical protein